MRLLDLLAKDLRVLLRNRALLAALLVYPFLLALVMGAAFQEPPSTLDLAVVDHERPAATADLGGETVTTQDLLAAATPFAKVRRAATDAEAIRLVRSGEVDAALVIPEGFLGDLTTLGQNASLTLIVDESDPVRAGVARNAVEGAIEAFVKSVVQKKIDDVLALLALTVEGGTTRLAFVDVNVLGIDNANARLQEVRATLDSESPEHQKVTDVIGFLDFAKGVLGNSELYLESTALPLEVQTRGLTAAQTRLVSVALPGALVLGLFWTGGVASALLSARDRETGAHRRLAAAPRLRILAPASRTLAALLATSLPAAVVLVLGLIALGARIVDPLATLGVLVVSALAAAALGALAASLARASSASTLIVVLALLPMLLLGGLFYPVAYMPAPAQTAANLLPLTLATDALRGAMLRGSPPIELAVPVLGLLVFAAAASSASLILSRREA